MIQFGSLFYTLVPTKLFKIAQKSDFRVMHLDLCSVGRTNKIGEKVMCSVLDTVSVRACVASSESSHVGSCLDGSKAQRRILE